MSENELLRELIRRDIGDAESRMYAQVEELRAAVNVLIERVALLTVETPAAAPPDEPTTDEPTSDEPAADEPTSDEPIEDLHDEPITDPDFVEEVTEIVDDIAEEIEAEAMHPSRPFWLDRRISLFGRGEG